MIVEDDVIFVPNFMRKLENAMRDLPDDWHGLWLNGFEAKMPLPYSQHINKCLGQFGGFGYVVHERWYDVLISELEANDIQCDETFVRLQPQYNVFSTRKKLVLHSDGVSTIQDKFVSYTTLKHE